jgi:hypothetical protein
MALWQKMKVVRKRQVEKAKGEVKEVIKVDNWMRTGAMRPESMEQVR